MNPLNDAQIRASLVNASRREVSHAALPDLDTIRWDRLDYLGWRDRKAPLVAYVVTEIDDAPTGILLRVADRSTRTLPKTMCAWCEDVVEVDGVTLLTARRAGAPGRRGDSIGTLLCEDFRCSANVRKPPTASMAGPGAADLQELIVAERIAGLRRRSAQFVAAVASTR